jgi:hypothetical protein
MEIEIKDQKIIDSLADTLEMSKDNLGTVKILSTESMNKMLLDRSILMINTFFKKNFLKRIDYEINRAAKLNNASHVLLLLSELRQKAISIKDDSEKIGFLFELTEQLGAACYSILVADSLEKST